MAPQTPRRALIGNRMQTPSGAVGIVTGIDSTTGLARVVLPGGTTYEDVPQDQLTRPQAPPPPGAPPARRAPRRPKLTRSQQIDQQRAEYHRILAAWATATHRRLMQTSGAERLYVYLVPSTATTYGQLLTVAEGEEAPAGAQLVTGEPVSAWKTRDQLAAWITKRCDWLPMYPNLLRS